MKRQNEFILALDIGSKGVQNDFRFKVNARKKRDGRNSVFVVNLSSFALEVHKVK